MSTRRHGLRSYRWWGVQCIRGFGSAHAVPALGVSSLPARVVRCGVAAVVLATMTLPVAPVPVAAQQEIVIVLPEPTAGSPEAERFRVELNRGMLQEHHDGERETAAAAPPGGRRVVAIVNVGELSPLQNKEFGSRFVNIRIVSPWGFFPPYEVSARALTAPDPISGDLSTADYGVGLRVNARWTSVNPDYDYDPTTVAKNIDDVPMFLGTIESLGQGLPRTPLYRTDRFQFGRTHVMRLIFAVGPQFFTPTNAEIVAIEISVATV